MKKIMFNDRYGLTQAVLGGRKTQTRRLIPQSFFTLNWDVRDDSLVYENEFGNFIDIRKSRYARYMEGEVVAVAQSYRDCGGFGKDGNPLWDYISNEIGAINAGWTNKLYVRADLMPHQIKITNVRIERLQDISDEDCLSDGVIKNVHQIPTKAPQFITDYYPCREMKEYSNKVGWGITYSTPREAYAVLINKVSGKGTWDSNPWVWVYEFELVK